MLVADVARFVKVDDFFRDVGGVIADALEIVRDAHQAESTGDGGRTFNHETGQFAVELLVEGVDALVAGDNLARQFGACVDKRVQCVVNHAADVFGHARDVDERFEQGFAV